VSLDKVTPGKEMSFASMNGTVDVTAACGCEGEREDAHGQRRDLERFSTLKLGANSNPPKVEDDRKSGGAVSGCASTSP